MALRRSYTAIVERNVLWQGEFATEPYEAAWCERGDLLRAGAGCFA